LPWCRLLAPEVSVQVLRSSENADSQGWPTTTTLTAPPSAQLDSTLPRSLNPASTIRRQLMRSIVIECKHPTLRDSRVLKGNSVDSQLRSNANLKSSATPQFLNMHGLYHGTTSLLTPKQSKATRSILVRSVGGFHRLLERRPAA
jgi:hypothetical protein